MQIHGITTPIVALSPMDGVTDAAYRFIQKKYGNPDLIFTEFTHVHGLAVGAASLFRDFLFDESERPVIAQVFGAEPEYFYLAAKIVAALGYDGIDINMGCPMRNVAEKGSGAALIQTPELAKEIVRQTIKGTEEYFNDQDLSQLPSQTQKLITAQKHPVDLAVQQANYTFSVKTRIGYHENTVTEWVKHLNEMPLDWLTIHGRTLKQLYSGKADLDAIALGIATSRFPTLANGDISSAPSAVDMLKYTKAAGVLIGRGTYGNPWIFRSKDKIKKLESDITDYRPTLTELKQVMLEHADLHLQIKGEKGFLQMRKNLAWYAQKAPELKSCIPQLVRVNTPAELADILAQVA